MDGLLDFPFNVHGLLVNDFDPIPVDLMVCLGLVFPDGRFCLLFMFTQSLPQDPSCLSFVVLSTAVAYNAVHHARFLLWSGVKGGGGLSF